jgi:inositol-phosphate phosphatase / L-galactose 1-phosphate phosphatase / histidinol-phosphatase
MSYRVPDHQLAFANHLADLAGAILRDKFANPPIVETKADGSPVTDADRAVEQTIRAAINHAHPSHGIVGEEFPPEREGAEHVWIIDPLDGTKEYVQGLPLFGVLIALCRHGRFVLGLADQPQLAHRWLGADGHGTTRNCRPVHTRACAALSDAVISTMGYDTFCADRHALLASLRSQARSTVTADSFYVFGLLAEGRMDLIVSDHFALHDYAALEAIVRNAGGTATDWLGQPLSMASSGTILAAGNATLHADARAALRVAEHLHPT